MTPIDYSEIEHSYDYVNFDPIGTNEAYISLETGKIYWLSDFGDSDELPSDFDESDQYVQLPNKHDLDLGKALVMEFASSQPKALRDDIKFAFNRRGAYRRLEVLLSRNDLLDDWRDFENRRTNQEIRKWCNQHGILIAEDDITENAG